MRQAVVVIGSSYGDEGKGLASARTALQKGLPCLNVLINGGAQRGHTVEWRDGRRHVFHHFGSAAAVGADSCADEDFIVNPLLYGQELEQLEDMGLRPRLLISSRCRVSLPWDMILGQIIEENRGRARHGSCGCGIQETRVRFLDTSWALPWGCLSRLNRREFSEYCRRTALEYLPERLRSLDMRMEEEWRDLIGRKDLEESFWRDWQRMLESTETYDDWTELAVSRPFLLFEAGQGLALDAENRADFPYLTPSRTTSAASARRIAALPGKTRTEILYVTRTYLTRHGAGPFPTECPKERINSNMEDRTNVPNPHQQSLRYGIFDAEAVLGRISRDQEETRKILPGATFSLMITHLNETEGEMTGEMKAAELEAHFDRVYRSDNPWFDTPEKT